MRLHVKKKFLTQADHRKMEATPFNFLSGIVVYGLWPSLGPFKQSGDRRMTDPNLKFTDIERELADDRHGKHLFALRERLKASAQECRAQLDKGLPPEQARRFDILLSAYQAAEHLLPLLWKLQQRSV